MKSTTETTKKKPLEQKIDALFSYRKIPWLLEQSKIKKTKSYYQKLIALQLAIYQLDGYLESCWDLDKKVLNKRWNKIIKRLTVFGLNKKQCKSWCREIYIYQKQEIALRKAQLPTRRDIEFFYRHKSCDVKLIRNLIYHRDPSLELLIPIETWTDFDYLTEVNDDIEDLYEDLSVYNANRFLFSIFACGNDRTETEYRAFIKIIQKRIEKRLENGKNIQTLFIEYAAKEIVYETLALLNHRLYHLDFKKLARAKTIKKWQLKGSRSQ